MKNVIFLILLTQFCVNSRSIHKESNVSNNSSNMLIVDSTAKYLANKIGEDSSSPSIEINNQFRKEFKRSIDENQVKYKCAIKMAVCVLKVKVKPNIQKPK